MTVNKITPRIETVTLYQGDDEARLRELNDELDRLRERRGKRAATADEASAENKAAQAVTEFAAEAVKRGQECKVRAVGRKTWRRLISENPPREDNRGDQANGVNDDGFSDALVPAALVAPTFGSDEERDEWLDSLSPFNWGKLYRAATRANGSEAEIDPKALSAIAATSGSDETSESPSASG